MRDILDLDKYPLDRPDSPEWEDLVRQCRAELAERVLAEVANISG